MKIARQRPLKFQEWYVSSNRTLLTITTCHYHSSRLFPGLCTLKSNWSGKKTKSLIAWGMINFISYLHSIIYFFFALSLCRPYSWILWTLCSLSIKGKARAEFAQEILFCVDYSYVDCAISCHVN